MCARSEESSSGESVRAAKPAPTGCFDEDIPQSDSTRAGPGKTRVLECMVSMLLLRSQGTVTIWPAKPKVCAVWPFVERAAEACPGAVILRFQHALELPGGLVVEAQRTG